MRLDKFLSDTGTATRSESKKAARAGLITVDGLPVYDTSVHIDPEKACVVFNGSRINYKKYTYVMLNKPDGYVSATEEDGAPPVTDLLPDILKRIELFPCGRLDKNTLGLLILTNNGELAHKLLSPKKHVEKTYRFECGNPLSGSDIELLEKGVDIGEKSSTKPAKVYLNDNKSGTITVYEGKFHQIKRMFAAVGNKIKYLERISFAGIPLDGSLKRGEWRYLDDKETILLEREKAEQE